MDYDEKLSILKALEYESTSVIGDASLQKLIQETSKEQIIFSIDLNKFSEMGFKKRRIVFLTKSLLINTDGGSLLNRNLIAG